MSCKKRNIKNQIKKILRDKESDLKKYFFFKSLKKLDENIFANPKTKIPNKSFENLNNDTLSDTIYNEDFIDFNFTFENNKFLDYLEKNKNNQEILWSDYKKIIFDFSSLTPKSENDRQKFEDWIDKIKLNYNEFISDIPYSFEFSVWNSKIELSNEDVKIYAQKLKEAAFKNWNDFRKKGTQNKELEKELVIEKNKWTNSENLGILVDNNIFWKDDEYEKALKINDEDIKKINDMINNHDLLTAYKEIKFKGFKHTIRVWYNEKSFKLTRRGMLRTTIVEHPVLPIIISFVSLIIAGIVLILKFSC